MFQTKLSIHSFHGLFDMQKHVCIVGSGTAGLITAIMLRGMFPLYKITVVSSSSIGIIGVGEGSTEHWRQGFQTTYNINVNELVSECAATHKYGIRFENWTNHTPDYFHSVSLPGVGPNDFAANYAFCLENNRLLTSSMISHLYNNNIVKVTGANQHDSVNQFHFDTNKLNNYLTVVAKTRDVTFIDDEVINVKQDTVSGFITEVGLTKNGSVLADFFVDASGFRRALMSQIVKEDDFVSYRKYLPTDSAAVFQTESDPSGEIRPYTRARALSSGWVFEIPTQERRGNGYIYASDFCSDDQAVKEVSDLIGKELTPRIIKFKSGYYKQGLKHNCVAVGLAGSFVEPLEATSISTTIQQARMIGQLLPTFNEGSKAQTKDYNKKFADLMDNILVMISLHYVSDRTDSEMWKAQQNAELPETLQNLLELWKERVPSIFDFSDTGYGLFHSAHLWHVAQGQGVLNTEAATTQLNAFGSRDWAAGALANFKSEQVRNGLVDHGSIFKQKK